MTAKGIELESRLDSKHLTSYAVGLDHLDSANSLNLE